MSQISQIHQFGQSKQKNILYLSGYSALKNGEQIKKLHIGAILTLIDSYSFQLLSINYLVETNCKNVQHKWINVQDDQQQKISKHFHETYEFIFKNLKTTNVLVHCRAGMSRSACIVIAYMMRCLGLKYNESAKLVRSKRYMVDLNIGFIQELKKYQIQINLQKTQNI